MLSCFEGLYRHRYMKERRSNYVYNVDFFVSEHRVIICGDVLVAEKCLKFFCKGNIFVANSLELERYTAYIVIPIAMKTGGITCAYCADDDRLHKNFTS